MPGSEGLLFVGYLRHFLSTYIEHREWLLAQCTWPGGAQNQQHPRINILKVASPLLRDEYCTYTIMCINFYLNLFVQGTIVYVSTVVNFTTFPFFFWLDAYELNTADGANEAPLINT